jgi:hypothetical protein
MGWKFNRTWRVVLIVLVLLVAFRLSLPYIVARHVNNVLSSLDGYRGSIHDIDIHLYRCAYQIDSIKIFKVAGNQEIPFVSIPLTDLSIEWDALFNGALVGEISFHEPVLNFIGERESLSEEREGEKPSEQTGEDVDWTQPINQLMPFDINRLNIHDGKLAFYDLSTSPKVDLFLDNVELEALNLNNAKDNPEPLPSRVYLQATSIGNGQLNMAMRINVLKHIPDLDLDLRFENVDLRALNDFFKAYGHADVEAGRLNLYAELAASEGEITGYAKPLFTELKVVDWKKDNEEPAELLWDSMVGFLTEVFENQRKNQFVTRVPLEGEIDDVDSPFLPALWGIFANAFVEAFEKDTDRTVSISTLSIAASDDSAVEEKKSKKDIRKEKRREKREQRRRAKKEKKQHEDNDKASRSSVKDNS